MLTTWSIGIFLDSFTILLHFLKARSGHLVGVGSVSAASAADLYRISVTSGPSPASATTHPLRTTLSQWPLAPMLLTRDDTAEPFPTNRVLQILFINFYCCYFKFSSLIQNWLAKRRVRLKEHILVRATVSDWLLSLLTKKGRERFTNFHERIPIL